METSGQGAITTDVGKKAKSEKIKTKHAVSIQVLLKKPNENIMLKMSEKIAAIIKQIAFLFAF